MGKDAGVFSLNLASIVLGCYVLWHLLQDLSLEIVNSITEFDAMDDLKERYAKKTLANTLIQAAIPSVVSHVLEQDCYPALTVSMQTFVIISGILTFLKILLSSKLAQNWLAEKAKREKFRRAAELKIKLAEATLRDAKKHLKEAAKREED